MSTEEQREFLESGHTAIVTTIRKDGRPSAVPIWYVMVDGHMYIGTPSRAAKLGHLKRDPRCCVLVETGEKWRELAALQFQADAVILESGPEAAAADAASEVKYEAFRTPPEQMPASAQALYGDSVWIRLDPVGEAVTWKNSKIRLRDEVPSAPSGEPR
jgi:Pyridoxamine 5'-phosphate oxidase